MTIFSATDSSKLNSSKGRNEHKYVKRYELKKKVFTIDSQNGKEAIGMQLTFILKLS